MTHVSCSASVVRGRDEQLLLLQGENCYFVKFWDNTSTFETCVSDFSDNSSISHLDIDHQVINKLIKNNK